jgi:hypothetical protein
MERPMETDPMLRSKDELSAIVDHISVPNSPLASTRNSRTRSSSPTCSRFLARVGELETDVAKLKQ